MLKRFGFGCLGAIVGYFVGLGGGIWLVSALSSNQHDRSVEAATTSALLIGPLIAIVCFILGFALAKPATPPKT